MTFRSKTAAKVDHFEEMRNRMNNPIVITSDRDEDCGGSGPDVGCDGVCYSELADDACGECGGDGVACSTVFNVDMNCAETEFSTVHVTGPFCGWCGGEEWNTMSDDDGDGVYSLTLYNIEAPFEYKYMIDGFAGQEDLTDDMADGGDCAPVTDYWSYANRLLLETGNGTEVNETYGSCLTCDEQAALQLSTIDFEVDMNGSQYPNADYDNVVINGSWNGWNGWGVPLADDDGDGVYTGSLTLDAGTSFEYVVAVTGPADFWSGWGQQFGQPGCDGSNFLATTPEEGGTSSTVSIYVDDLVVDECGVCGGEGSDLDCNGDCYGEAFLDECGVCSGGNSGYEPGSDVDECGVCFGDDMSCATIELSYGTVGNGSLVDGTAGVVEVLYSSTVDVYGFQFNLSGATLVDASSDLEFISVSSNTGNVIGFSLTGITLEEGEGVLAYVYFDPSYEGFDMCMSDDIISSFDGLQVESFGAGCVSIDAADGVYPGDANLDGDTNILDAVMSVEFILGSLGIPFTDLGFYNADLDQSGELDILDLVAMVDMILETPARLTNASYAIVMGIDNSVTIESDGYVGAIQMTLSHIGSIDIEMSKSSFVSGYHTEGNTTTIVIVKPESTELFTVDGNYTIEEVLVANADGYIDVNVYDDVTYSISGIYPNPFNPETTIEYMIPSEEMVSVSVYDLTGKMVATLSSGVQSAGYHSELNAGDMPSGLYFVKFVAGTYTETQKIMLVK